MVRLLPRYNNAQLIRSRNPTDWESSDLVIDVGGKYDGGSKWFDHHQREFNETFNSNFQTKLSSAGLIYKHFEFIEALDANDNGINNYSKEAEENKKFSDKNITLPAIISKLNPSWNTNPTDEDFDKAFETSSKLMGDVFINLLDGYGKSWLPARSIVEDAFNNRLDVDKSGEILVLGQFCPWKEHLYQIEKENDAQGLIKFVLFKDSSDKWRISTVSVTSTSFEFRLGLPEAWRGIRDQELSKLTGVPGCIFVHAAGFIGGANSQESVLELAKKSLAAAK
ncbi:hypothetical protein QCA50_018147 [Cerrena zonata]|uniref:Metal-dependent protein hydrolase n=1 Tax=Cerrena zonata TaxID=2478898 RepID=A0AAW0FIG6_9APHY